MSGEIRAQLEGGDHRIANVWVFDQEGGYRVQLPLRLASKLVAALTPPIPVPAGLGEVEKP